MSNNAKLQILQHSLGVDQYGAGRQFRNHFVTGPGSGDDWGHCMSLVGDGLMTVQRGNALTGGSDLFHVTPAGVAYVATNSPKPPKLARGQQRYEDFLNADSGLKFGEWLGVRSS